MATGKPNVGPTPRTDPATLPKPCATKAGIRATESSVTGSRETPTAIPPYAANHPP